MSTDLIAQHTRPAEWINPIPKPRYALVVLGGGSAGLVAASVAAGFGVSVALIEKHALGGDCLHTGCVPSKALLRSAKVIGEIRRGSELGVCAGEVQIDFSAVMRRVREVQAQIAPHDGAVRYRDMGVDVFFGAGRFIDSRTVDVNGARLRFDKAIIASGSRPITPPILGLQQTGFLTNETLWQMETLPARLAIIGGGPIGCELAQAFQRLGSAVTVIDVASQLLPREDADAAAIVQAGLVRDGARVLLGTKVTQVQHSPDEKTLALEQGNAAHPLAVDEIIVAVGRAPNVEQLGLEAVGVNADKNGIITNDFAQSSNSRIYAAGDVAFKYKFTHAADFSARVALRNALFFGRQRLSNLLVPWVTFTDPEVAHVGLYEREAAQEGLATRVFEVPLNNVDRARADGVREGFARVLTRAGTDQILGASIVAPHAGEMINEITLAMRNGLGLKAIANTIHPYPTASEAIRKTADAWNRERLTPLVKRLASAWLR